MDRQLLYWIWLSLRCGAGSENGTYLCAASREQADRAVSLIGDSCRLVETETSDHVIHTVHSEEYIKAVNSLLSGRNEVKNATR